MQSSKIVFFETEEWERNYINNSPIHDYSPKIHEERLSEETANLAEDAEIVSVFIYSEVDKGVLDRLPNLRMLATRSTGYDHIDVEECARRGIAISNVPYYGENTVAEHAFGLILSLSRKIYKAVLRTAKLDFSLEGLRGMDLKDKTIGVIGSGRIGLHVVRIAKGFGMNVIVYDIRQEPMIAEVLGFSYVSFEELLQQSDVISLHAPLNKGTYHMLNTDNINLIKRGAILVNTARGGLIQPEALLMALDQGIISGAGLDVMEGEESVKEERAYLVHSMSREEMSEILINYTLLHRDNVVITPHIGFYSQEALQRIMDTTTENIMNYLQGKISNLIAA